MKIRFGLVAVVVLIAGCQTAQRVERNHDAVAEPEGVQPRVEKLADAGRGEVMVIAIGPMEGAKVAAEALKGLGFGPVEGTGMPEVMPEVADHFYARVPALTAAKQSVVVECRWVEDGKTEVEVRTTLEGAERAYVVKRVQEALTPTAAVETEERLETDLVPVDAVNRVLGTFAPLGFAPEPDRRGSDCFIAQGAVRTAEGQLIEVEGKWPGSGKTVVVIRMRLEGAKRAFVVEKVKGAISDGTGGQ